MPASKANLYLILGKHRRLAIVLLILGVDILVNLLLLAFAPDLFTHSQPVVAQVTQVLQSAAPATSTPFQPMHPTPTRPLVLLPAAIAQPVPEASPDFYGLDFSPNAAALTIRIQPNDDRLNRGAPIVISVRPAKTCTFGDKHACVSLYRNRRGGNVIFVTVHSGIGGQAESYRRALEGLGLNQAAFSLGKIQANLDRITDAQVQIAQGDHILSDLRLGGVARLPAGMMFDYYRRPPAGSLELAASAAPNLSAYLDSEQPIIVFETCGWKLPGEPWAQGISSTSASVYLGVIQKKQP